MSEGAEGGPSNVIKFSLAGTKRQLPQDEYDDEEEEKVGSDEEDGETQDWTDLIAKADHSNRPLYVGKNKHAFLERFSPFFRYAEDFMIAIAEPVSRCQYMNEYILTQHSLHAAVSMGLNTDTILSRLNMLCKTELPYDLQKFIRGCTASYGQVKMVIVDDRFYLETTSKDIYDILSKDVKICEAKTGNEGQGLLVPQSTSGALPQGMQVLGKGPAAMGALAKEKADKNRLADAAAEDDIARLEAYMDEEEEGTGGGGGRADEKNEVPAHLRWQIEIERSEHINVKAQCVRLEYPCLEEYDFANDSVTPNLNIEARAGTFIRSYQEKSLSKMFSHGRARSGFIVLPCGAGKTLVSFKFPQQSPIFQQKSQGRVAAECSRAPLDRTIDMKFKSYQKRLCSRLDKGCIID